MGIMKVTVKESGLKRALNTYSVMAVNELSPVEGEQVGCEVVVLQPKEKLVNILVSESFEDVVKDWEKDHPKPLELPKKKTKKKAVKKVAAKKKAPAKKKASPKKKVVKKKTK